MIVRRPAIDGREVMAEGLLTADEGLVGDYWLSPWQRVHARPAPRTRPAS